MINIHLYDQNDETEVRLLVEQSYDPLISVYNHVRDKIVREIELTPDIIDEIIAWDEHKTLRK